MGIAGLLVGRLADVIEPRVILAIGLASLALVGYVFSFVTPLTTAACLVLFLVWMRVSNGCILSRLNVAAFQHIFLLIALLHVATIVPELLMVSPKREKGGGLPDM
jgi:predicted MFS family arabinose efflux permease